MGNSCCAQEHPEDRIESLKPRNSVSGVKKLRAATIYGSSVESMLPNQLLPSLNEYPALKNTFTVENELEYLSGLPRLPLRVEAALRRVGKMPADLLLEKEFSQYPTFGPCRLKDDSVYLGQFKDGKRHGMGVEVNKDGEVYTGYFRDDVKGPKGRFFSTNGDCITGEVHDGKIEGYAEELIDFCQPGDSIYDYIDSLSHATNTTTSRDVLFAADICPTTAKGIERKGIFIDGLLAGQGTEKNYSEGYTYSGQFVRGKWEGKGTLLWKDGTTYSGEFLNGQPHGQGTKAWFDSRSYSGSWRSGKMEGFGVFAWGDGKRYVGMYVEDKKQGFGEFYYPDGSVYRGNWVEGKQEGFGTLIDKHGKKYTGKWRSGEFIEAEGQN